MARPLFQVHPGGRAPQEEPVTEILPAPSQPLAVVRVLLEEQTDEDGHLLLRKWRGDFLRYVGPHWVVADSDRLRKWLYERLEHAKCEKLNPRTHQYDMAPWAPDKAKIDRLLDAMIAPALLDREVQAPVWLSTGKSATGLVPCLNGLVDVTTRQIAPPTPDYFGTVAIPFEYNPDVGEPIEWLKFLRSLWPRSDGKDAGEIRALRQWMGYVLSGRLELQKMLLVVGPPRCGKGTIARTLRDLVGPANCSAPTLAGIAQNFGLETSIDKTLMIVGDARLSQQGQEAVVERLLSISGQDTITLDRKNKPAWTGTMQTRIMILSNELPRFVDASGAIASRFLILKLERSFLGEEDTQLEGRLRAEFPAILKWALAGLVDLNKAKRLHEPPGHIAAMREMYDLVSPIAAFLRDVCGIDETDDDGRPVETPPDAAVPFAELYSEYETWCTENGRHAKNTAGFSSDLKSRLPGLKTDYRPRAGGRRMPRHVQGLQIRPDWTNRVRPTSRFRATRGGTRPVEDDDWHKREPPDGL